MTRTRVVAGLDVGAGRTKCLLMAEDGSVAAVARRKTQPDFDGTARRTLHDALAAAGLDEAAVAYVAATGLGRHSVGFRQIQITDITCSARAARALLPGCRFLLDIGAQCTRAIRLGEDGKVEEFRTNEKCAAGSGGFLERTARYLEVPLEDLGALSARAAAPQPISSICAVLAETEIINHISEGALVEDIVHGVHVSLADRAQLLLRRVGMEDEVALLGGVALQEGMVLALRNVLGCAVRVPPQPDLMAAAGAAMLAWFRLSRATPSPA